MKIRNDDLYNYRSGNFKDIEESVLAYLKELYKDEKKAKLVEKTEEKAEEKSESDK